MAHRSPVAPRPLLLAAVLLALCALPSCTIIRYVDPSNNSNGEPDPIPPKLVDMLIMVELDRTTVQLADDYQGILTNLTAGLAKGGVSLRKVAVAPMYRRIGNTVPLIYGEGAEDSEFDSFAEAIGFFALDDGQKYLRDTTDSEGENLATVGMLLDTAYIYHPTTATTDATPYFSTATDGFIVLQITAKARSCSYDDAGCALDGKAPAQYFTAESNGRLDWLQLSDATGLPKEKVFFINVATAEGVDEEDFVKRCEGKAGFDQTNLDSMEPSAHVYYETFAERMGTEDGWAEYVDMCDAMSLSAVAKLAGLGSEIGNKLRK